MDDKSLQFVLITLNVGLAHQEADWNWENVTSPFMLLYYVTEGFAQVTIGQKSYNLTPGHVYMIPAFATHSYHCTGHFVHYYLHLYQENRQGIVLDDYIFPVQIKANQNTESLFKRICQINPEMSLINSNPQSYNNDQTILQNIVRNKQRSLSVRIETRGIIYQLMAGFIAEAVSKIPSIDNRIENSIKYIRKEIFSNIEIETLSQMCCMSKDHFIRLFKKEVGETPTQYINHKKIEQAQLLLLTKNISVKEVAYSLSFTDDSYFSRLFKKVTGMTPNKYRTRTYYSPNSYPK